MKILRYKKTIGGLLFILMSFFLFSATSAKVTTTVNSNFYENGDTIVYTIKVENPTSNPLIDYKVENLFLNSGKFSSVVIASDTSSPGSSFGTFNSTGNFYAEGVGIPVDGFVQYKVTATLKTTTTGTVVETTQLYDETLKQVDSSVATVEPVVYNYTVTKTAASPFYNFNGNIVYTLTIQNNHATMPLSKISVTDILSTITATSFTGTGPAFDMSNVTISASGTNGSNTGTFSSTGDLSATNVTVAPSSNVKYVITAKVNNDILGDISNQAKVTDKVNVSVNSNTLTLAQSAPVTTITKSLVSANPYNPGGIVQYLVAVKNTGTGIAYNRLVKDLLGDINVNLASNVLASNSASDISGTPFSSVSISASLGSGSTKSTSDLLKSGGVTTVPNLEDDNVVIYPGETINYTITANTNNVAISNIPNSATLINKNDNTSIVSGTATAVANTVLDTTSTAITRVKTTTASEYKPGNPVEYSIVVSNTDTTKFANNINITDLISQITAKTYSGATAPAFKNWVLTVDSSTGAGTKPGDFNYGSTISSDISLTADIAPRGSITYKLVAVVNDDITGVILDSTSTGQDNVKESGSGIKMSAPKLSVEKNVNTTEYISGNELIYNIHIDNDGDGIGTNIPVKDILSSIQTELTTGGTGSAYSSWEITAEVLDANHNVINNPAITNPGISGMITSDLNTTVTIAPSESIEYTVKAIVNPLAKGRIINKALVNNNLVSDKGAVTKVSKTSISKSSDMGSYPVVGKNTIKYTIVVSNNANNGIALNVPIKDTLSTVQAELLEPRGSMVKAYTDWTISAVPSGTGTTVGTFSDNQNLDTTVNIAPGGNVTYTITATLNSDNTNILYGSFSNTATSSSLSGSAVTVPKTPNLAISKITREREYDPASGTVTYEILVSNNGDGYANDAVITDALSSVVSENGKKLSGWTITSEVNGIGTTSGTYSNNADINTRVDIAPKGYVKYVVSATIESGAMGKIVNTSEVLDTQSGNRYSASASISENVSHTLFIRKSSDSIYYAPGKPLTYNIEITNNSPSVATDIRIEDKISEIKGTLANNGGLSPTDILNQGIFASWDIYKDNVLIGQNIDLNDLITSIVPGNRVNYKIVAIPKDNVVEPKIKNIATLYDNNNSILGTSLIENNIVGLNGYINRSVDKVNYNPGVDTITYTITVGAGSNGYYNNVNINELIKDIKVDLIDGTQGNPFLNPETGILSFTVVQDSSSVINTGTTPIPVNGNQDIVGVVDIRTGDKIVYKITGTVRKDALGVIDFKSLTTSPYRPNLSLVKKVIEKNYSPGQKITYSLSIENNSKGNAQDYNILDDLRSITVLDSDGNTVPAFKSFEFTEATVQGYKANFGTYSDNNNLDTLIDIPANGGKITYTIEAIVNDKAIGDIINLLEVEDDTVSSRVGAGLEKASLDKKIIRFYDTDGTPFPLSSTQYIPGGYIEYDIVMKNSGKGILANYNLVDDIAGIRTDYYDGTTGVAFDSWTISLKEIDTLPSTNPGTVSDNNNINTSIDIAPNGYVTYTIRAKINEKAVGIISNNVALGGLTDIATAATLAPSLTHTKVVKNTSGSVITTFTPGQTVVYTVTLSNSGGGISYNNKLTDIISTLSAEVVENGTNGTTPKENPFTSWDIAVNKIGTTTTLDGNYSGGNNFTGSSGDINLSKVAIAPRGSITFTITGRIKDTVLGTFTNTSTLTDITNTSNVKTARLNPQGSTITKSKVISKLNGVNFTNGMTYKPGDTVQYLITINNTGGGFSNNLTIVDNLDSVTSLLNTGSTGPSLENITIATVKTDGRTYLRTPPASGARAINTTSDLSPGGNITFTIDGNIKATSMGTIAANTATVGGSNTTTSAINPKAAAISATKELISPATKIYKPNDVVNYKLTIKNTGEGYGINIPIKDEISKIQTTLIGGVQGNAFTSWTIIKSLTEGNGVTTNTDVAKNNTDINITNANIAPGATIVYDISATVNPKAVGQIINTAYVNTVTIPAPAINLKDAAVSMVKTFKNATYTPGGEVEFYIDITNSTDTTASNVLLEDLVKDIITDLSTNMTGHALQSNFTYTQNVTGDYTNTYVGNFSNGNNLFNLRLDIAPQTSVRFTIKGNSVPNAIGKIKNDAKIVYNGITTSSTATVDPIIATSGNIKVSKVSSDSQYAPGTPIQYTLKIKNEGTGYATGVKITDYIKNITTTSINGGTILAFESCKMISNGASSQNTVITNNTNPSGYDAVANIAPGDTITVVIEGTVNYFASGAIENIVTANYDSTDIKDNVTITPMPSMISIKKSVDKLVYVSEDILTYTVEVSNIGQGPALGVNVEDKISEIETSFFTGGGGGGPITAVAFDPSTIIIKRKVGSSSETTLSGKDINDTVNIPSNFRPGENKVVYTVTAKINQNADGDIKNTAKASSISSNEVISKAKIANLEVEKKVSKSTYEPGGKINYTIIVKNTVDSPAIGMTLVDDIKDIKAKANDGSSVPAFKDWKILSITANPTGLPTLKKDIPTVGSVSSTENILIEGDMGAKTTVTIEVEATVNNNITEIIENKATVSYSGASNSMIVKSTSENADLTLEKKILTIDGAAYNSTSTYIPGRTVEYEIKIYNNGLGFAKDIVINDDIKNMVVETSSQNIEQAYSTWTYETNSSNSPLNIVQTPPVDNTNFSSKVTLAPKSFITFKVKGVINSTALGVINENIVTVFPTSNGAPNGLTAKSEKLNPGVATIKSKKEIIEGKEYIAGGDIKYQITVENESDFFAKDLVIEDIISNIKAESVGGGAISVFDYWNIDVVASSPNTNISGAVGSLIDLNNTINLAPKSTIVYTIAGKVKPNVVGDIINIAEVKYDKGDNKYPVTSSLKKVDTSDIEVIKSASNAEYTPGSDVTFEILIKNKSNNVIDNFKIKDEISKISSTFTDGTPKPAFINWTISSVVNGDSANSDISSIPTSGDINSTIDIGKSSSVLITITGRTSSTSVGEILNTAYWTYNTTVDKDISAKIDPTTGDVSIVKTVNSPTYNIGDTMTYKLQVSNTGLGFAKGVMLSDDIKGIVTEISNSSSKDKAFKNWTVKNKTIPANSSIESENTSNGYSAILNIYPGETIEIEIAAELNNNVLGEITNKGIINYNSLEKDYPVTIKPGNVPIDNILITKEVSSDKYVPGDKLTYTIRVKNTSKNWANDVNLQDNLNEIETRILGGVNAEGKAFLFDAKNSLNETFDLAPNTEVEYVLEAVVAANLVGVIQNTAILNFDNSLLDSNMVITNPIVPDISFNKEVVEKEYIPGKPVTYKITLKNGTPSNLSGVSLTDYVRDIKVKNYLNNDILAFTSWKTEVTYTNQYTKIYSMPNDNENIDTLLDIGANDEVIFTVVGVTSKEATGEIINTSTETIPRKTGDSVTLTRKANSKVKPYLLDIRMEQRETIYNPGEWIEYDIIVKNLSDSPALNIELLHLVKNAMSDYIDGTNSPIFTDWKYEIIRNTGLINTIDLLPDEDIDQNIFLDGNADVLIRVKAKVASEMIGDIKLNSNLKDPAIQGNNLASNYVEFTPSRPNIAVTKTSQVLTNPLGIEDTIIYTVSLENIGSGNGIDLAFKDELSKIIAESGEKAFDSWTITYREKGNKLNTNLPIRDNQDIDNLVILENNRKNSLVFTITATLNKLAFGSISNTATVRDEFGKLTTSTVEDKIKDSRGQLLVYKKAFKDSVKPGDAVEYEVIVKNQTEVTYENIILVDRIPAGFKYLKKSAHVTFFDKTGKSYKNFSTSPVLIGKNLNFEPITIKGKESFSVRYLLKPSIGVTIGKYENRAYATSNGETISNTARATVEVTADPLFDTASIIGKVFHDLNGDNYQNNPEADDVLVKINIDKDRYIPKSSIITLNKVDKKLEDSEVISAKGIYIKKIKGIDSRVKNKDNEAIIRYRSTSEEFPSLKITTVEGITITVTDKGEYISSSVSDVESGMNSQILSVKQNIYNDEASKGTYIHELVISNNAYYENGIPGVRVFNADGILVETDAYGRYHIPDQWILNRKGENIVIKVDEGSLPEGMKVTSENPYLKRVSSKVLNQFNFSVQEKTVKESE